MAFVGKSRNGNMRLHKYSMGVAAIAATTFALTSPASAEGLALSRFDPAPAGDRFFGVQSPYVAGEATPHLMILGDYANNPLVLRGLNDEKVGAVVGGQLLLHLNGSFALWNRLNVNVDVPFALAQTGDSPRQGFESPSGADFGDIRVGLRYRILGGYYDAFQLAVGGYAWLPTGSESSMLSQGEVRGMPQVIVGGRTDRIVWTAAAGPEIRSSQNYGGIAQGTMVKTGAGVGFLLDDARRLQVGPEITVALTPRDIQKRTTNAEALLGARYRFLSDFEAGLAAGPGLTSGIGTPDFRAVFMLAYTPEVVRDRDGDGIFDDVDACPDEAGVASSDPSKHGCPPPPDRDGDGIPDDVDACPDIKGVASEDPATNGCPPDTDGDGIRDDVDACPKEKGKPNEDPEKHGCPVAVRVTETEIQILQQVQFDTGKATIKRASDGLLDEVAGVLKDHPEIIKIEVQGHTDNRGSASFNRRLSQNRANSVRAALVARGIAEERLVPKGYGPDSPIADNKTATGRQQNRRAQFVILEKAPKGENDAK